MISKLYSENSSSAALDAYRKTLEKEGFSEVTIKNYIGDIKQFLRWRRENSAHLKDRELIDSFSRDMAKHLSFSSVKRKTSSVKNFLNLEKKNHYHGFLFFFIFGSLLTFALLPTNMPTNIFISQGEEELNGISTASLAKIEDGNFLITKRGVTVNLANVNPAKETNTADPLYALNTEVINSSAMNAHGAGTIQSGKTEVILISDFITESSFISLTLTSSTKGAQLYIKSQNIGVAVVTIDEAVDRDITFKWKADNTEVYRNIL